MKKYFCIALLSFTIIACQNEDDINSINNNVELINSALTVADGFIISEFVEDGVNETAIFTDYVFQFNSNGSVSASKTNQTVKGAFLVFQDDGRTELRMTFPNTSELFELTDDWYFISQSQNTIRFEDNGGILQFQK